MTSSSASSSEYDSSSREGSVPNSVPSLDHRHNSVESSFTPLESIFDSDPHTSANTYCTTVASCDDDEDDHYNGRFGYIHQIQQTATPATPEEFAKLFPSGEKRLLIKHDDSTLDGHMNVRVDTMAPATTRVPERRLTLFHVRMYDIHDRDFSVRRYGRECGREVAHVKRKMQKTIARPNLQRSVSKALSSFMAKHDSDPECRKLERSDSGYGSVDEEEDSSSGTTTPANKKATNTCTLEFSNYAHVDLTRKGAKTAKKYDFEYWGKSYSWRRTIVGEHIHYSLTNNATANIVAQIRPDTLTPYMAAIEEAKGGFVPPSSMYIYNNKADPVNSSNADVADVIVTTGLVALIDDCIKRKSKTKRTVQLTLPTRGPTPLKMDMEYVGPKKFLEEMFHRKPKPLVRSSTMPEQHHQYQQSRPTPPTRTMTT
ncbi:hypothetical protein FPQ18DRAFT_264329 [Pyronema domesticum]|nr:hypothetical protein FPQ18DRAFT_264329 [Pyronema domesticum]